MNPRPGNCGSWSLRVKSAIVSAVRMRRPFRSPPPSIISQRWDRSPAVVNSPARGHNARRRLDVVERRVAHLERRENLLRAKLFKRFLRDALDDRAQQDDVPARILIVRVDRPLWVVQQQLREDRIAFELPSV